MLSKIPPILTALSLPLCAFSNPVSVPFETDFSTEFGDFYAPTGNGYNWGQDWRAENYHNWVSADSRTVTATMQAKELQGVDFVIRVTVDPVELIGTDHSIGFGACGSNRTFGSHYLADVKPASNRIRIIRISGGNDFIGPERDLNSVDLTDMEPFELILVGSRSGNSIMLNLTVKKDGSSETMVASDSSSLDGSYFGLRGRNGSGGARYEFHFDDYSLDRLNYFDPPIPVPTLFAPVGEWYSHVGNGVQPDSIPSWAEIYPSGGFYGTPQAGDAGTYDVRYPGTEEPYAATLDAVVVVPAPGDAVISEFMADNDDTLTDEDGDASDWIELFNPTSSAIDLTGWHLTDDAAVPEKWEIPGGTVLAPFSFKVIFATGKVRPDHAGFKLDSAEGGYLALVRPDNSVASEFSAYPKQREDISYGVFGDYSSGGYLLKPTPGAVNDRTGFSGFTGDTVFSVDRGFFNAPFSVDITCGTPGATIVYTTDGSTPTLLNGTASASPATVVISETTVLRAAAFADGLVPANTDTQTYLFLNDVKNQDSAWATSQGWPSGSVNGQVFNYGMDPDIVNGLTDAEFETAMKDIPTISMVTDIGNFTDPETGFWVNAENRGRGWERPVSLELINPDESPGFQIDAGVRMRGGFSRQGSNPKHSFHFYFRSEYGTGKLNYPLFGEEGVDTFDALDLRATQGRSWHFSNSSDATFNRDVFGRDCQRDMGQAYSRSRYYHLYINGQYFGLFQTQERVDANHAANYFGGAPEDYDVIKTRTKPHRVEVLDGDPAAWTRLYDAAVAGFAGEASYLAVQGLDAAGDKLVDIDNLIDYMLVIFYTGQSDGPVNLGANVPKNFFAFRPRDGSFGFRFYVHDNEDSFQSVSANSTGNNSTGDRLIYFNPKWLHQRLMENADYRQRFQDRAHRHLFNGGALTVAACQARFQATSDMLTNAIIGESARWGDYKSGSPYTQSTWQNAVDGKIDSWIPQRHSILLGQLRSRDLYPDVDAPVFSQHGGQVMPGYVLTADAPDGVVYYTVDGSDPMDAGAAVFPSGGGSEVTFIPQQAAGWRYFVTATGLSGSDVVHGHPSYDAGDWKHPDQDDSAWLSGQAPLGYGNVGVPDWNTEIAAGGVPTVYFRKTFTVSGAAAFESLNIGLRRDDGAIVYLNGREIARSNLAAGSIEFGDFASTGESAGESTYYPHTWTLNPGDLVEGENVIAVEVHQASAASSDFVLDLEITGVSAAAGLVIGSDVSVMVRALDGGEWSALTEATFYTSIPAGPSNLEISEIFYNPPGASEDTEYVELRNTSDTDTIHLDGLRFTAGITFDFPAGLTLAPGERILVVKNMPAFEAAFGAGLPVAGEYSGSLDNGGETLTLDGILTFRYNDKAPWPELADGDGRSLVFKGGDVTDPANWRASAVDGGTPAGTDSTVFPGGNFDAYAFGGLRPEVMPGGQYSFPVNLAADDVDYILESSVDLAQWIPAENADPAADSALPGTFASSVFQVQPLEPKKYLRMRAVLKSN